MLPGAGGESVGHGFGGLRCAVVATSGDAPRFGAGERRLVPRRSGGNPDDGTGGYWAGGTGRRGGSPLDRRDARCPLRQERGRFPSDISRGWPPTACRSLASVQRYRPPMRLARPLVLTIGALALAACSASAPGWTYAPAPSVTPLPSVEPSASADASAAPSDAGPERRAVGRAEWTRRADLRPQHRLRHR